MTPRVLVTGAGGFIGRPAVAEVARRGYEVHGVGRHRPTDLDVDAWHTVDLLDPSTPDALVRDLGASHLLHLAWCTTHGRFWSDPANLDWAGATLGLVAAFARSGGQRVVVAGGCTQYDWSDDAIGPSGVVVEATTPRAATHLYGRAKEATTDLIDRWAPEAGVSYATGLVFFPYGPHEKPDRLVPSVARRLLAGEEAETTAGAQVRDFVHVADCGRALAALVDGDVRGPVNIGSGTGARVADVAAAVARAVGRDDLLRVGALLMREGEARSVVADVTRLRDEVGFVPAFDLDTGIHDAVDWWRAELAPGNESSGR